MFESCEKICFIRKSYLVFIFPLSNNIDSNINSNHQREVISRNLRLRSCYCNAGLFKFNQLKCILKKSNYISCCWNSSSGLMHKTISLNLYCSWNIQEYSSIMNWLEQQKTNNRKIQLTVTRNYIFVRKLRFFEKDYPE